MVFIKILKPLVREIVKMEILYYLVNGMLNLLQLQMLFHMQLVQW